MEHTHPIYDITPFTMLDYPDNLACIVWFAGCSMACNYCYNPKIVLAKEGRLRVDDLLSFLDTRKNNLDAVVLSGGECTTYPDLLDLCTCIQKKGFKIKIDTNGSGPQVLQKLLDAEVIDYVALDYKAPAAKFKRITNSDHFATLRHSLQILIHSSIPFEVRTTVHGGLLTEEDIHEIATDLYQCGYTNTYYLQEFNTTATTLGKTPAHHNWIHTAQIETPLCIEIR